MKKNKKIICFGEVLWDVFPSHKKIGGAPLNVALRLNSFGNEVWVISRIGRDEPGNTLLDFIQNAGIHTGLIQWDDALGTGEVKVTLDAKGSAAYEIIAPRAFDRISLNKDCMAAVEKADVFIFGSLITRDAVSGHTLFSLLKKAPFKVFDVNLRAPFYEKEMLLQLMQEADFIKFNDDELFEIAKMMHSKFHSLEQNIQFIAAQTETKMICVTKGSHGAVLLFNHHLYYNSGYRIAVRDTVGAGDSFLAALIDQLIQGETPQKAIDFACAVGALVASEEGANPALSLDSIVRFMDPEKSA